MKVVLPEHVDNAATAEELAANVIHEQYEQLFHDLQADYADLFAAQDPEGVGIVVEDMMSYLRGLQTVAYLSDSNNPPTDKMKLPSSMARPSSLKSKYFRIPLDEPYFTINTDTRVISVPTVFQQNGVGVKGDANAEIVFFECPRIYDGVDLYTMIQNRRCYIQWTNTAAHVSGNSVAILADATTEVVYFGWMITADMTSVAGALEFSVRFFDKNQDDEITYSLSTQKSSVQVKTTMDLNVDTIEAEDVEDLVKTRPIYSFVVNSMEGQGPRVLVQPVGGIYNLIAIDPEDDEMLANYPVAEYPDGVYVLTASAQSPDGKDIVYNWYHDGALIANATHEEYVVTQPGTYYVIIGNGDVSGYRYVTSPSVTVPAPEEIKYTNVVDNKYFGYGVFSDNSQTLSADIVNTDGAIPNGKVKVTWYRAPMLNGSNQVITNEADRNYVQVGEPQVIDNSAAQNGVIKSICTLPQDVEGWYKCTAVNTLNNAASTAITTSDVATVRAIPTSPDEIKIEYDATTRTLKVKADQGIVYNADVPSKYRSNEYHYQWVADGGEVSASNRGSGIGDDFRVYAVEGPRMNKTISYFLKVSHVIYKDNKVAAGKAAGTAVEKESVPKTSNIVTLTFTYENGYDQLPTVTVVEQ